MLTNLLVGLRDLWTVSRARRLGNYFVTSRSRRFRSSTLLLIAILIVLSEDFFLCLTADSCRLHRCRLDTEPALLVYALSA